MNTNQLSSNQIKLIKDYWMKKNSMKSRIDELFAEIENSKETIDINDINLNNSFRELGNVNSHEIKSSLYWLEYYLKEHSDNNSKKVKDIYNLLLDVDKKINEALNNFDCILSNSYSNNNNNNNDNEKMYDEINEINRKICVLNDEYNEMLLSFGLNLFDMNMNADLFEFINYGIFSDSLVPVGFT